MVEVTLTLESQWWTKLCVQSRERGLQKVEIRAEREARTNLDLAQWQNSISRLAKTTSH